jgi:hypothetical protein
MRRWFILALIVLLPLRGWVGEAMAGEMLAQHLLATKNVAANPVSMGAAEHKDCMGHATQAAPDAQADSPQPGSGCPTCAQCQACSSFALALPPAITLPPLQAVAVPGQPASHFASADVARGFKPPIS